MPVASLLVPSIFMLVGGIVGAVGYFMLARARASRRWPSVSGQVVRSEVVSREQTDTEPGTIHIGRRPRVYSVALEYAYEVDGTTLKSKRVAFTDSFTKSEGQCEKIAARYPVGSPVTVYYDPEKPTKAVLDRATGCGPLLFFGVGSLFFLGGVAALVLMLRSR